MKLTNSSKYLFIFPALLLMIAVPVQALTPTPTSTPEGSQGEFPLTVNPLPESTCDPDLDVCGTTGVYANVNVVVTDISSGESRSYFDFTGTGGGFCVPVVLYMDTINGISVEACDDVWPPDCTTRTYVHDPYLTVDTTGCNTPTPTATGTPTPCCNDWMYATCYVRDAVSGDLISGAFIAGSALSEDRCTTGPEGYCYLDLFIHDTQYFSITVTADGYAEFSSSYPAQPYGVTVDIDLVPLHTPTPAPTATPTTMWTQNPCMTTGIEIDMPGDHFRSGDPFSLTAEICNSFSIALKDHPVFVILEINQSFFFAPSFDGFDHFLGEYPPGKTAIPVIPEFIWPNNIPAVSSARVYAAILTPSMTRVVGEIVTRDFSWE